MPALVRGYHLLEPMKHRNVQLEEKTIIDRWCSKNRQGQQIETIESQIHSKKLHQHADISAEAFVY